MSKHAIEPHKVSRNGKDVWRVLVPKDLQAAEKGKARYFKTREDANDFCAELRGKRGSPTLLFNLLSPAELTRLATYCQEVGVPGIDRAMQLYRDEARANRTERDLDGAIADFITAKEQANRRHTYISVSRTILENFAMNRGTRNVSTITRAEIEQWLNGSNWQAWTRWTYRARLETFFDWCTARGYRGTNPAAAVEVPSIDDKPIVFLAVPEVKRLLTACRETDPSMLPYFCLSLFAGLRPDEAKAMTWGNIVEDGIEVFATKKRSRRRRIVEWNDTLRAWLKLGGMLPVRNFKHRFNAVRDAAGIEWVKDILRHTFCTYAYPLLGPAKTAMSAGHRESVLFQHYRGLVARAAAEEFWKLTPAAVLPVEGPPLPMSLSIWIEEARRE
jgi:integrase